MLTVKEIIRPGTYTHINPQTGKPEQLSIDSTYPAYLHDQTKAMLKAGLSIPLPLEHQPDAKPQTAAERAADNLRNNTGWLKGTLLRGDRLYGLLDVQDEEIYRKLPRTIRWTSPWLTNFTDGNGKSWKGVMGHLALTSRPRITNQEPFTDMKLALTTIAATSEMRIVPAKVPDAGIFISRAGLLDKTAAGFQPHHSAAFGMLTGAAFDLSDMMKKEKPKPKEGEGKEGEGKEGKEKEGEKKLEGDEQELETEMEGGDESEMELTLHDILCDVCEALWGIELPEGMSDDQQVKDALIKALTEKKKAEGGVGNDPINPQQQQKQPTVEHPPMYMSLTTEQVKAITDPEKRQLAEAFLSLRDDREKDRKQTEALRKTHLDAGLRQRTARIERLARVVPRGALDKLNEQSKSVMLSLSDEGQVVDPMAATLEILEAGLKELPAMLLNPFATLSEMAHPVDPTGKVIKSEEHRKAVVAELMGKV